MRRKILATLMSLSMLLSAGVVAAQAADFKDTDSSWAKSQIERWSDYKVVQGNQNGEFMPTKEITRAEAAQVFVNLLGLTEEGDISKFSDIDATAWYAPALRKAVAAGVMQGSADGKMMPNDPIERRAYFVMFARAMALAPQNTTKGAATTADGWSEGYINALTDRGYVKGGDKGVDPTGQIDRASVMALMDQTIAAYCNTDNATLTASANGITLVAAKNVTVSGTAGDLVIAAGAAGGKTTLRDLKTSATVTVDAKADTEVAGSSTITNFVLGEKAASTTLTVLNGSTITNLTSKAANATIAGAGKVENASIEANDNKVTTNGTKVTVAANVTGTTAKGAAVAAGSSTTTSTTVSSGGGGGGGSSSRRSNTSTDYTYKIRTDSVVVGTIDATTYGVNDDTLDIRLDVSGGILRGSSLVGTTGKTVSSYDTVNVTVASGIGSGDVTIEDLENIGTLTVEGGGSNSIHLAGVVIKGKIDISDKAQYKPRLDMSGVTFGADFSGITASAGFIVESSGNTATIPVITIVVPGIEVDLNAVIENVDVASASGTSEVKLNLLGSAKVTTLTASTRVAISTVTATAPITTLIAENPVTIQGNAVATILVASSSATVTVTNSTSSIVVKEADGVDANVTVNGESQTAASTTLMEELQAKIGTSVGDVLTLSYSGNAVKYSYASTATLSEVRTAGESALETALDVLNNKGVTSVALTVGAHDAYTVNIAADMDISTAVSTMISTLGLKASDLTSTITVVCSGSDTSTITISNN